MQQPELNFTYPHHPGWKKRTTSEDAADAIAPKAPTLRDKVYQLLKAKPMTADECAEWLGEPILSIRPRLSELARMNKIVDTGERRKNDSGKNAIVWKIQ